jgi:hypothetical protein
MLAGRFQGRDRQREFGGNRLNGNSVSGRDADLANMGSRVTRCEVSAEMQLSSQKHQNKEQTSQTD